MNKFLSLLFMLSVFGLFAAPMAVAINCYTNFYDLGEPQPVYGDLRAMASLTPVGPPSDPQVGYHWLWYCWDFSGMPFAVLKECTVRGKGDNIYVVVEDSQWNVEVNQADVDQILQWFDHQSVGDFPGEGIWQLNTETFGMPPDSDGLSRIFFMYYDFNQSGADGFFWWYDQYPDETEEYSSNECDVIYLNTGTSADPGGAYLTAVGAHEFEHMIQFNHDANEEAWVDEGCAELAMWLFGNPDSISGFSSNPDNNLTNWDGNWSDYIKTYLWTLYLYEHYGEYIGVDLIETLVGETANGVTGVNNALADCGYSQTMADIFNDWVIANYLDDTSIGDGYYGYATEDLPAFHCVSTWDGFPVDQSGSLNHWAGEYIKFQSGGNWFGLVGDFTGQSSADYILRAIKTAGTSSTAVEDVTLDADNHGDFTYDDFGNDYDQIILVPINRTPGSSGTNSYSYTADAGQVAVNLLSFTATPTGDKEIIVEWRVETTQGEDILGYNLYRRQMKPIKNMSPVPTLKSSSDGWVKVNPTLIEGMNPYSYVDKEVETRNAYEYKLEAVLDTSSLLLGNTQSDAKTNPTSFAISSIFPNPASDSVNLELVLPDNSNVEIEIYDLSGRLVMQKNLGELSAGEQRIELITSGLQNGVYTIIAQNSSEKSSARLVVTR
jgi:hypothetical protein